MAEWLGWWTITAARKRRDLLLDERLQIHRELKKMPAEFNREFAGQTLPAHLVMGTFNTGGWQVRWRLRGRNGQGQSFVALGGKKAPEVIAAAPPDLRRRLLEYERRGYWLNSAVTVRDREITVIEHYLVLLERQRAEKRGESE